MRRVAGVFPRKVQPTTWITAIGVAGFWTAAALYVADHISSQTSAPPKVQSLAVEPVQTPNRAAKAARDPVRKEASLAPDLAPPIIEAALPVPEIVTPLPEDGTQAPAETGHASWYDLDSKTASGEPMDPEALTAAHPTLPLGTKVRVANLDNGRDVVVRINDRGPFARGRVIDLSHAAASEIGLVRSGLARVRVEAVGVADADGRCRTA
jgi:rare lipoprotein A